MTNLEQKLDSILIAIENQNSSETLETILYDIGNLKRSQVALTSDMLNLQSYFLARPKPISKHLGVFKCCLIVPLICYTPIWQFVVSKEWTNFISAIGYLVLFIATIYP